MPKIGNKNNNNTSIPTLAEYITTQIAAKRTTALDKSRNRTSVRVPMVPNSMSEEDWKSSIEDNIRYQEERLSRIMNNYDGYKKQMGNRFIQEEQEELDRLLEEKDKGYPKLVHGSNCMYNAGDCYGLNIPGNLTFAAKHKELGFKKAPKGSMKPGDIVQDVSVKKPIHAMIYDSKDSEGNLLFNYARGHTGNDAFDINKNYKKQAKYTIPIKDFDVYKYVGTPADSTQWINEYKQLYGNGMRCGGRRKAQLGLDIREGGIAIPIAPNMYYMDGRSHDNGGIAIGPNNKNGLEVEGGEVVKVGNNDIKVFSSVPLLRGVSPAQLVMGGANPDTVFKAQEEFKNRNRINDDGTTYEVGGEKIYTPSKSIQRQIQETGRITIGGSPTIGGLRTAKYVKGLATAKGYVKQGNKIFTKVDNFVNNSLQGLINKRKITANQADVYKKFYNEIVGVNGVNIPKTASFFLNNNKEMKFGGSMIYTINGNVRNGLMSARPKAEWGKVKDENRWRYKTDPENFVRGYYQITPYGRIDSDGESYIVANGKNVYNTFPNFMNEAIKYQTNKRPQYYAEKRLPIAGSQSIAEKVGLARSGWSYGENPTFDYVPNINISVPTSYAKAVGDNSKKSTSSTPRREENKSSKATTKSVEHPSVIRHDEYYSSNKPKGNSTPVDESYAARQSRDIQAVNEQSPSPTGGGTQSKDGLWIPQFRTTTVGDWIGVGTNLAGHIASYFANNSLLKKYPMPNKPVMTPVVKLKTKHNIEPGLTNIDETTQVNRSVVRRNTQSSNTSLAREQRLANEARNAKNQLYGQKENIETQLINQDRRNRQDVYSRNVAAYNDWLNKTYVAKSNQLLSKQQNMMNLINGIPMAVNSIIGNIESRRATNNTIKAIAAANPNVDGRMFGIGDYYTQRLADGRTAIYNKNHKLVKYV